MRPAETHPTGQGLVPSIPPALPTCAGDLLNNYCEKDPAANVARAMYTFIIMLTYPIELHVTREVTALGVYVE